jgi:hypothetical protein
MRRKAMNRREPEEPVMYNLLRLEPCPDFRFRQVFLNYRMAASEEKYQ